jgi:hypothetical protein
MLGRRLWGHDPLGRDPTGVHTLAANVRWYREEGCHLLEVGTHLLEGQTFPYRPGPQYLNDRLKLLASHRLVPFERQ